MVVDATGEVFGEAPNIAARVESAGRARLGPHHRRGPTADRRAVRRGGPRPTRAQGRSGADDALSRHSRERRGRRAGARALTSLVGRDEELDLLAPDAGSGRASGEGQLVLIVGEPGIGKSRLINEFHARLGETPHTWVEWSSSQLLQNTPLHPIVEWGRQRFGADLPAEQRLADLENTLRLIGLNPTEYAPLLAPLVDILLPEDRAAKLAPEELRRRQLAAMIAWFLAGARTQAVVLAFEDLHWADPTSLDLLQALAERGAQAPLLILATARPEFRPPWSLGSHHSVIALSPLDRADVARMVRELAARHALSREVVEGVSERSGGVPLFVEEVTRLLLERGEAGGLYAIPPTLQQSLAARLDRLGEAREVAQIGAVLGRDFTSALLSAVGEIDDPALQSALDRLAGADLLIVEGAGPAGDLSLQARADPGRGLRQPAQEPPPGPAPPRRRNPARSARARRSRARSRSPIISPKPASTISRSNGGARRAIMRFGAQPSRRRSPIWAERSRCRTKRGAGKAAGASGERQQLQVAYGNALFQARGYGAAGDGRGLRQGARVWRSATRTRPNGSKSIMPSGPAISRGANCP